MLRYFWLSQWPVSATGIECLRPHLHHCGVGESYLIKKCPILDVTDENNSQTLESAEIERYTRAEFRICKWLKKTTKGNIVVGERSTFWGWEVIRSSWGCPESSVSLGEYVIVSVYDKFWVHGGSCFPCFYLYLHPDCPASFCTPECQNDANNLLPFHSSPYPIKIWTGWNFKSGFYILRLLWSDSV